MRSLSWLGAGAFCISPRNDQLIHVGALSFFRVQEKGGFQHLLENGMDFSSSSIRKVSFFSDTPSTHTDTSVTKELSGFQTEVSHQEKEERGKTTEETKETRSSGSVSAFVYRDYLLAGSNWFAVVLMLATSIACQALSSGSDVWLSHWTAEEDLKQVEVAYICSDQI